MDFNINEEIEEISEKEIQELVKLIKAHNKVVKIYTAEEYLENLLEKDEIFYSNYVLKTFLKFNRHEQIFTCIAKNFCIVHKIKDEDKLDICILLNLLIFETNADSYNSILSYFVSLKPSIIKHLLDYVTNEEFLVLLTEVTCRRYHSEYTLDKVVEPLVTNMDYINKLKHYYIKNFGKKLPQVKPLTKPVSPRAGLSKTPVIASPPKDELPTQSFTSKRVPKTTYQSDDVILKKLQQARNKNQKEALALLEIARKRAFACAQTKDKNETSSSLPEEEREIFKAQKPPKFKKVEVKPNAVTLMREAALMVKKCEAEVKKIDNLTNTQFDFSLYEELEERERKKMQLEQMQDIKKKHLQGLLTYEEAILAKQNVIKINQEKMEEFKEEKVELYKKLEDWREEEQKKIKALVEKSQQIEQRARNAQNEIIEDKHRFVKMIQKEKKQMLDKALEEKERELSRKIELIKDLKALQSLRNLNQKKEFDPTETSNLGLMCEMSIAELQERLFLLKIEVEEELKNKKKLIHETRRQRQELVEQAQQFIAQNKQIKEKSKKSEQLMAEDTEEILALRKRFEDARKLRLGKEIF